MVGSYHGWMEEGPKKYRWLDRPSSCVDGRRMSFSCPEVEVHVEGEDDSTGEGPPCPALARGTLWQKSLSRSARGQDRPSDGRGRSCDKNDLIIIGAKVVLPPQTVGPTTEQRRRSVHTFLLYG